MFPGIKNFANINRYPIYKEKKTFLKKKQNKSQFSMVKSQLMVYENE